MAQRDRSWKILSSAFADDNIISSAFAFSDLKICTFNCCSARSNFEIIKGLCSEGFDIIFLQETFLIEEKLGLLDHIDYNYHSIGIPAVYSENVLSSLKGRPSGGLACLFKKNAPFSIEIIKSDARYGIINCKLNSQNIILVNVYMPYDDHTPECVANYVEILAYIENSVDNIMYDGIYICGDYNADPFSSRLWPHLTKLALDLDLVCFDFKYLNYNTFTYVSNNGLYSKWLDHVIGTENCVFSINKICVRNDIVGSDHFPVEFIIRIKNVHAVSNTVYDEGHKLLKKKENLFIDWSKITKENLALISNKIVNCMQSYVEDLNDLCCDEAICHDKVHMQNIDSFYDELVLEMSSNLNYVCNSLKSTHLINTGNCNSLGNSAVGTSNNSNVHTFNTGNSSIGCKAKTNSLSNSMQRNYSPVPGWNRRVKSLYKLYRIDFINWVKNGRSRDTLIFFEMQSSRQIFKTALSECKKDSAKEIAISIAEKFRNKESKEFWSDVKKNKKIDKRSAVIDGLTDEGEIVRLLTDSFSCESTQDEQEEQELISNLLRGLKHDRCFHLTTSIDTMKKHITNLNSGTGHDCINAKFLKNSSDDFLLMLCRFLNSCFTHGHFPGLMLQGIVKPRIKNASGNCTDSKNYRPVMQSSNILKLVELHLQDILIEKITFNPRQFGYTKGLSTSDATFVLKEVVYSQFKTKDSTYALFIDLSRAFDNVNHFKLGKILLKRNISPDIVWILLKFLRNQKSILQWGNLFGEPRNIDVGVRQGGILSPFLFKLYIDHVLNLLSEANSGIKYNFYNVNVIGYADDIILLSRSLKGLEELYTILKNELLDLNLRINTIKSKILVFNKRKKEQRSKISLANEEFEVVHSYKYLGHILSYNLDETEDISFRLKSFYGKFFSIKKNFSYLPEDILLFLFKSFCLPNYGLNIWNLKDTQYKKDYRAFEIAYSNCLKSIYGLTKFSSTHFIFNACDMLIFSHYIHYLQCSYFKRIFEAPIGLMFILPSLKQGVLVNSICKIIRSTYQITIFDNPIEAIKSRIYYVQNRER